MATIFDAFQAATRVGQSIVNVLDKKLEENAQIEFQDARLQLKAEFDGFLGKIQDSGNFEDFEALWSGFREDSYNTILKKISSKYAQQLFDAHYKEEEMKQRLTLFHIVDTKRREESFVKATSNINNIIDNDSFSSKEIINKYGNKVVVSAASQKKKEVDYTYAFLLKNGLMSFSDVEKNKEKTYSLILFNDATSEAHKIIDNMGTLDEAKQVVTKKTEKFYTGSGRVITLDNVLNEVNQDIESYYYKKQRERYLQNEKPLSELVAKKNRAIVDGNIDTAKNICIKGLSLMKKQHEDARGDSLSADDWIKYDHYFSLQNFDKGNSSGWGGLSDEQMVNSFLYMYEKKGLKPEDIISYIWTTVHPGLMNSGMREEEAGGKLVKVARSFLDKIKGQYCPDDIKNVYENAEKLLKNQFISTRGDKYFKTTEGQQEWIKISAGLAAQLTQYHNNTKSGELNSNNIVRLINDYSTTVFNKQLTKNLFTNEKTFNKIVADNNENLSHLYWQDTNMRNIAVDKMIDTKNESRNFAVKEFKNLLGLTQEELLQKYVISTDKSGSSRLVSADTGELEAVLELSKDNNGDNKMILFTPQKINGKIQLVPIDKSGVEIKKTRDKEQQQREKFLKDSLKFYTNKNTGKADTSGYYNNATSGFESYVKGFNNLFTGDKLVEEQKLFHQIKTSILKNNKDLSQPDVENKIIEEHKRTSGLVSNFEKNGKKEIPVYLTEGTREDFFQCYNSLKNPYEKVTFIDAYYQERKNAGSRKFSLLNILENFMELAKQRDVYNNYYHVTISSKLDSLKNQRKK